MAKKLVVQRNLRKPQSGAYLKYLVFSAIGLIFLVVITPYLLRDKSRDASKKMPVPDQGAVTKEMPMQAQQQPAPQNQNDSGSATTPGSSGSTTPPQAQPAPGPAGNAVTASQQAPPPQTQFPPQPANAGAAAVPPAVSPPQAQPLSQPPEEGMTAPQQAPAPEAAQGPPPAAPEQASTPSAPPAESGQANQGVLFPKKGNPSEGAAAAGTRNPHGKAMKRTAGKVCRTKTVCTNPAHKPKTAQSAKPGVCPRVNGGYAVQVGSVFKSAGQAESLQKKLAAKGYRTSIRRTASKGYLVLTCPTNRSSAYTLREQLAVEGLKSARVVGTDPKPAQAVKR
ncbi:MAG: SPOR domain-containing protein [Syntrophobacteraceae bacterium]|nr:SPOR domain-containing protein [Syntrophobacteraceae bacterium]